MNRRKFISLAFSTTAFGSAAWFLSKNASSKPLFTSGDLKVSRQSLALGTMVSIAVYDNDPHVAENAITEAFRAIDRVENLMSLYRPDSQLSCLNRDGVLSNPAPELVEVLSFAQYLSRRTEGAFDVTVQPLWELYAEHAKAGTIPTLDEVTKAKAKVGWHGLSVAQNQVGLTRGAHVTLNGIAQGYAADAARRALQQNGITCALIDSGEVGLLGQKPNREDWCIGIKHPREQGELLGLASMTGRCMATSGDYETHFSEDFRNNHIFDPRTGYSPEELASVTVTAKTALEADALSTAAMVLGVVKGIELIRSTAGAEALFVTKSGKQTGTSGFPPVNQSAT